MAPDGPCDGLTADTTTGYLRISDHLAGQIIHNAPIESKFDVEDEPFARGKKAVVRRCRERSSGKRLAAKYLRKRTPSPSPEIIHEVAVLHACRHSPHVVQLHSVFESNSDIVLLLELGAGGELQTVLDRDEVPGEAQVARVMRQVLQALVYLHDINIVHLDLKPQNIVLTGEFPHCDVKLCDFGISRYLSKGGDVREILGTPDYVAPEVLNYEPISLATDMWSVGVLMYVLLSGCSPFGGDTKQETFCNISQCRLDFPDDLFEHISNEAKDLMTKLMVLSPSKRLSAKDCLSHPWFLKDHGSIVSVPLIVQDEVSPAATVVPEFKSSSEESTETLVEVSQTKPKDTCHLDRRRNSRLSERFDNLLRTISDREEEVETKKKDKSVQLARVESFRSMTRASGMQTMPITGFLKYSLGASDCDNIHKFRRVYIVDDNPSPPISLSTVSVSSSSSGFASADSSSISDSNSEVSEMSLDSSSDRSSIISLDDSLEFGFKGLSQRHYSSCYNVWEASEREQIHRMYPRECRGSVAKALSKFNLPEKKEKYIPKLAVFNNRLSVPSPVQPKKSTGLELMKERKGNLVIIKEIKTTNGSRFVRTSELKCESVQSRIRKFDPLKLDLPKDIKNEVF